MNKHIQWLKQAGITVVLSVSCGSLFADDIASASFNGDTLSLSPAVTYDVAGLRVSGENTSVTNVFQNGDDISMNLSGIADGVYTYELGLQTESGIDPASDDGANIPPDALQSGQFRIANGTASSYGAAEIEAEAKVAAELALAKQQSEKQAIVNNGDD